LIKHNCLIYNCIESWTFNGPRGPLCVRVSGSPSANTVETILSAGRAGAGIGMSYGASLATGQ